MLARRFPWLALLLPLTLLVVGCSDDKEPEMEVVYHEAYPVQLTDLAGAYLYDAEPQDDPPRSRRDRFGIPVPVEDFQRMRVVVVGSWSPARVLTTYDLGGGNTVHDTTTVLGRLDLEMVLDDDPTRIYRAVIGPQEGAFLTTASVFADWPDGRVEGTALVGHNLDATLTSDLRLSGNQQVLEPAHGTLTEVRLELLEADVLEEVP